MTSGWRRIARRIDHATGDADDRAADGLEHEVQQRAAGREALGRGHQRDAEGGQAGRVVDQRLALHEQLHALGDAHAWRRSRPRRRRRSARRRRPSMNAAGHVSSVDQRVRDDRDGRRRHQHEREREQHQRAALGAQLARRGVPAGRQQQRRDEDEQDDVGVELDRRDPGHEGEAEPAEDEHDRVRDADRRSAARTSRTAAKSSAKRSSRSPTERGSLGSPRITMPVPPLDDYDHVTGPPDAPLELIMYGDFQCPYCTAAQSIVARVRKRLDGRLRFAFRHLPLHEVHPDAQRAAEAAEAAAAQGRFWEMHDALYANGGRFSPADLAASGRAGGTRRRALPRRADRRDATRRGSRATPTRARAAGIAATPAFIVNGRHHAEAFDAGSLVEALEAAVTSFRRAPTTLARPCSASAPCSRSLLALFVVACGGGDKRATDASRPGRERARARTASASRCRTASSPDETDFPAAARARRCRSSPTRCPRARSSRSRAPSSPRPARAGWRSAMIAAGRDAGLRADRDLRRARRRARPPRARSSRPPTCC